MAAGLDVLQLDEPAFNVYMDDVAAWGIEALHRGHRGAHAARTAVHICYGYGIKANIDWKQTLGGEWRQYEQTFPLLAQSRIDQVSLECANSRVPLSLLGCWRGKDVLVGVIDVATARRWRRPSRWPRPSAARCSTCRRRGSTRAPTAAWCRCRATSRAASCARSAPAPRSSRRELGEA